MLVILVNYDAKRLKAWFEGVKWTNQIYFIYRNVIKSLIYLSLLNFPLFNSYIAKLVSEFLQRKINLEDFFITGVERHLYDSAIFWF